MQICRSKITVNIRPSFCLALSVCLLAVPLKIVVAWLLAAVFHELCHITVLYIFRVKIYSIKIGFLGAEIETEPVSTKIEFYAALAGPVGSVILIFLYRCFPTISFFALIQTVSNMFPFGERDGHRMLRCMLVKYFGPVYGARIFIKISIVVKLLIMLILLYICIVLKFLLPIVIVLLAYMVKIPCKAGKQIVQYKHLKG